MGKLGVENLYLGMMMQLEVKPRFELTLSLDGSDMRLILAALAGRLKPEQREAALKLQKMIAESRLIQMKSITNEYQKLVNNIQENEDE
jgi:hypothetical protein